jgi:SAM-dependent methyltransferase
MPARRYHEGVRRAIKLGLIAFGEAVRLPAENPFIHHNSRGGWSWKPTHTRPLCDRAADMLYRLRGRSSLRVLELGPGAGVAAAEIRRIVPQCTLTTIGLTPIDPFQGQGCGNESVVRQPMIDLQLIGDLPRMLPVAGGKFDFIYDNYGPIFWILLEMSRCGFAAHADSLISDVLEVLYDDGILFIGASDGALLTERMLARHAGPDAVNVFSEPIYSRTEIRTCVLARGTCRSLP